MSKWDGYPWPPPANKADLDKWHKGVLFVMRGGPADGAVLRLSAHPYPDGTSGWDWVTVGGARYERPDDVDPYMQWSGKVNKKRNNGPFMNHADGQPVGCPASSSDDDQERHPSPSPVQ